MSKAKRVKLLILDVDGVLSDGQIIVTDSGEEIKAFHVQDGLGIQLLLENNLHVAVITGRNSPLVTKRMKDLKIPFVYQGQFDKLGAFEELLTQLKLHPDEVAHVGDDLPDLPLIKRVGLGVAVANATFLVKQHADWQTATAGGQGAVREVCDLILKAHGLWPSIEERFLR
jgi:3-deoxy-D-manno-octulosonate 8-phosphate phosphatase (KDO 8-P phosphatase)